MPKTARTKVTEDTYDIRLAAAQSFTSGDRVRHKVNGRWGIFLEINQGFALAEVWVQFSSDNECSVPVSCNPLDLELVNSEIKEVEELPSESKSSESQPRDTVEQPSTAVEVVQELTEEEVADRHWLELKVDRAFYEAGAALRELRDRRLYRSTHKTFEEYCRIRFGFTYRYGNQLIAGSLVIENLQMGTNRSQNDDALLGADFQILPTKLEQVKPLTALDPDSQRQVWQEAVKEAGGKVPSGRVVKGIVERLKERATTPPPIPYKPGDVFLISCKSGPLRKYSGCWAIAIQVNEYTVSIHVHDKDLTVKPENLEPIDSPSECEQVRAIARRITRLRQCGLLDRGAYYVLEELGRQTFLTPLEAKLLAVLEQEYGIE